jgi:radical SAM superfamily enzyme YgiQ (UPF0313 family)
LEHGRFLGARYHLGAEYIRTYPASYAIFSSQPVSSADITIDRLARRALDTRAPVFGFTCYDINCYLNLLLAERIKKLAPEAIILFGGPSATFSADLILKNRRAVDICARGEGEETVRELLRLLSDGEDWKNICGISFRRRRKVIHTPDCKLMRGDEKHSDSLDLFPSPHLAGIIPNDIRPSLGILSSRGCPYTCTFCNFAIMSGHKIYTHSVERVLDELQAILDRAKEICREIIERKLNRVKYICYTRADKVDEELLLLMREAGVLKIDFGLESADPLVLNKCRKIRVVGGEKDDFAMERKFLEKIVRAVSLSQQIGLDPSVSIIFGLPGETRANAEKTLEFVRNLGVKTYYHNRFNIFAGTELFQNADLYGMRVKKSPYTLPYNSESAYDTYALPMIENPDTPHIIKNEKDISYFQKITGIPKSDADFCKEILFFHTTRVESPDPAWIETFAFLTTELGWIATARVCYEQFAETIAGARGTFTYYLKTGFG